MKNFIVIRVPIVLDENRNPLRRPSFGQSPIIVDEADSRQEAATKVASLSFGDYRHHYYGLELVAYGFPDRKLARAPEPPKPSKPPKGSRPKLAVNNEGKKEKRA